MEQFLKNLTTFDWILFYTFMVLFCVNSVFRIMNRVQRIRLRRLELKKRDLEQLIHPEGICPAIERIGEIVPDMCPQCRQLLKWTVTKE